MKKIQAFIFVCIICMLSFNLKATANGWNTGLDIYSSYVFRGTKFGSGPAFQPSLEYSTGLFSIGAWGSYNASVDEAAEADLYASFEIPFTENTSLALTFTDYYFPGTSWLEKDSHYFEPMVTLNLGGLSLTGAYMMNQKEGDIYLEAGYHTDNFSIIAGGGDGAYTADGAFNVCNISIGTTRNITISENFSIPISGSVILNPSTEQFHIVVGISL